MPIRVRSYVKTAGRLGALFLICTPFHPVCWAIWAAALYGTGVLPR